MYFKICCRKSDICEAPYRSVYLVFVVRYLPELCLPRKPLRVWVTAWFFISLPCRPYRASVWQWKPSQLTAGDGPVQCWDYFVSGSKAWAPLRRSVIGQHVLLGSGLGACIFLDSLSVLPYDSSLLSHFPTNPQTLGIYIYILINFFPQRYREDSLPTGKKNQKPKRQ